MQRISSTSQCPRSDRAMEDKDVDDDDDDNDNNDDDNDEHVDNNQNDSSDEEGRIARNMFRTDSDSDSDDDSRDRHPPSRDHVPPLPDVTHCGGTTTTTTTRRPVGQQRLIRNCVVLEEIPVGGSIAERLWPAAEQLADFVLRLVTTAATAAATNKSTTIARTRGCRHSHRRRYRDNNERSSSSCDTAPDVLRSQLVQLFRTSPSLSLIELGAGVGLTGLLLAAQLPIALRRCRQDHHHDLVSLRILLTDLSQGLVLLTRNVQSNQIYRMQQQHKQASVVPARKTMCSVEPSSSSSSSSGDVAIVVADESENDTTAAVADTEQNALLISMPDEDDGDAVVDVQVRELCWGNRSHYQQALDWYYDGDIHQENAAANNKNNHDHHLCIEPTAKEDLDDENVNRADHDHIVPLGNDGTGGLSPRPPSISREKEAFEEEKELPATVPAEVDDDSNEGDDNPPSLQQKPPPSSSSLVLSPLILLGSDVVYWECLQDPLEDCLFHLLRGAPVGSMALLAGVRRWKRDTYFFRTLGRRTKTATHELQCTCLEENIQRYPSSSSSSSSQLQHTNGHDNDDDDRHYRDNEEKEEGEWPKQTSSVTDKVTAAAPSCPTQQSRREICRIYAVTMIRKPLPPPHRAIGRRKEVIS